MAKNGGLNNANYPAQQPVHCAFVNDSVENNVESYDSDGFLPCCNIQELDDDPNDFKQALFGGDGSPMPEITKLIPESTNDRVVNLTIV